MRVCRLLTIFLFTGQAQYSCLIIGLFNGTILLRDLAEGFPVLIQLDSRSHCHAGPVRAIVRGPDYIITAGDDAKVMFWRLVI
jgi:hypothetical protein